MFRNVRTTFIEIIDYDATLLDAIKVLDAAALKVIAISDNSDDDTIKGTISDGDIRRALLDGASLGEKAADYSNTRYRYVVDEDQVLEAESILRAGYKAVPIGQIRSTNHKMRAFVANAPSGGVHNISAIIMAGGKGTRLRPLTSSIPKPLVDVRGKPMLRHQIDALKNAGVVDIYVSVGYLKEQIIDHFGDGRDLDVSITYLEEEVPLGTAGALRNLPASVDTLFCVNADLITNLDFKNMADYWEKSSVDMLTACQQYAHQIPFGVLDIDDHAVKGIHEKPTIIRYVNTGMYLLGPRALEVCRLIDRESFDIPDLIEAVLLNGGKVEPFVVHESWIDVGTPEALKLAHEKP